MNLHRGAIGKDHVVEGYVRRARAREVATQKLCFTSGRIGYRGHMSFDRRPLWNRDFRARINRLNQFCCNGLARLSDAQALIESAPKIIACSDHHRALWRM